MEYELPMQGVEAARPQTFARALIFFMNLVIKYFFFFLNYYLLEKACGSM
jgi:hypothetical protein